MLTIRHKYIIITLSKDNRRKPERRNMNEMTSKEVVNLIDWLKKQGMPADQILECIEYIEKHEPEKN